MIKTTTQDVLGHVYTRVIIKMTDWQPLFEWAKDNVPRDPTIPEPHGSWFSVPAPEGVEFYFYNEDEAALFLLRAPTNIPA